MPLNKVVKILQKGNRILLLIHQSPDGDTIAASLALYLALQEMGKAPQVVCKDSIPTPFLFLPQTQKIKKDFLMGDFEVIVVLDCGDLRRTGFPQRLKEFARHRRCLINIDHHPKNDLHKIANYNLIDYNAASVCEIVDQILKELGVKLNPSIATCLLTGLYTDTGGFKHSNTTPEVLKLASRLLVEGARLKKISKNIGLNKSVPSLKLWGIVLSRIRKNPLGIVTSIITQGDLKRLNAQESDLAGVVNLIASIPESKIAILFSETNQGMIKASLRTEKNGIDLTQLASIFGGGGHKKASGFTIPGKLVYNKGTWQIKLN